jgi:hypothetical protein
MAKAYKLEISVVKAAFSKSPGGFSSMTIDCKAFFRGNEANNDQVIHREVVELPLKEAVARRDALIEQYKALPHCAYLSMANPRDRKPPGFGEIREKANDPSDKVKA